ncbi:MAG: glycosyltransferase family 39 protein [Betaproteobacteria bacterium]
MKNSTRALLLTAILSANFVASLVGIDWGLPYRWNDDEKVDQAANMLWRHSLDPQYFINPHLDIYLVWAVTAAVYRMDPGHGVLSTFWRVRELTDPENPDRAFQYTAMRAVRALSAVLSVLLVWLLFVIGRRHFDDATGLLAAAFMAVTMGLVNLAHFATTETPLFLLALLSLFLFDNVIVRGRVRDYLWAGAAFGLAFSTKYTAWILVAPFLAAHVARWGWRQTLSLRTVRLALAAGAAGVAAFVLTTPYAVLRWRQFYDILVFDYSVGVPSGSFFTVPHTWILYLGILGNAMGWPLFVLSIAGSGLAVWSLTRGDISAPRQRAFLIHGVWIAAFYGFYGASSHHALRFIMPIAPSLVLLAAVAGTTLVRRAAPTWSRGLARTAVALVLGYSAAYTIAADRMFLHDTRYDAGRWLEETARPGDVVDYFMVEAYFPYLRESWLRTSLVPYVVDVRLRGRAFDRAMRDYLTRSNHLIVETEFFYRRFIEYPQNVEHPHRRAFYERLLSGQDPSGYQPVHWFIYRNPWWLNPRPEAVAPAIVILAKINPPRP